MFERDQFGPFLRRERERRGITLQDIATRTKIGAALLAALERNDFSRWRGGIYRRSFVRAYAEAIGLDAERTVANFVRLFPAADEACAPPTASSSPPAESSRSRALAPVASDPRLASRADPSARRRLTMAAIELAVVGSVAAALGVTVDWFYAWPALGAGALVVVAANLRLKKKPAPPAATVAPPEPSNAVQSRHTTKRRGAERRDTSRRHRPRRGSRRPRA